MPREVLGLATSVATPGLDPRAGPADPTDAWPKPEASSTLAMIAGIIASGSILLLSGTSVGRAGQPRIQPGSCHEVAKPRTSPGASPRTSPGVSRPQRRRVPVGYPLRPPAAEPPSPSRDLHHPPPLAHRAGIPAGNWNDLRPALMQDRGGPYYFSAPQKTPVEYMVKFFDRCANTTKDLPGPNPYTPPGYVV